MGNHEGWAQPSGLLLNGLLPNEVDSVTRVLDKERWLKAEERTAELIACIQPNQPSQELRIAVVDYVQRLIMKCFSCQVFPFGSVPLKTYLPDGDIDLTAFSKNQNLRDTWAQEVRDTLEREEKSDDAEFRVKEVQYIQAEVKIIKCLVENIVVDISFDQLGGLCTLCFLEEVDQLINQHHLFKRSIILIKAWCYYESRILGAHHGLISTYALETLVLYIFHVFNNSFAGPLEVLYRFLEFFSNFDWDNFCVSLWGPVPISSLPEMTAEPPRRDSEELLLSKPFLDDCNLKYAVFPGGQENQGQPFVSKHFNVIDPLRTNNNLGRSVSKGNFFRIRSAFAFGAKRLARLLECSEGNLIAEVNLFFMNTWDRHGNGNRPDASISDLWPPRPLNRVPDDRGENSRNNICIKNIGGNVRLDTAHESQADEAHNPFHSVSSHVNTTSLIPENMSRTRNVPSDLRTQGHAIYGGHIGGRISDHNTRNVSSNKTIHAEKGHRSSRQDYFVGEHEGQTRNHFARTQSSPELTDTSDILSQERHNQLKEYSKNQFPSARSDHIGRRKNMGPDVSAGYSARSSTDYPSPSRQSSSHQSLDDDAAAAADSNSISNSYPDDTAELYPMGEELTSDTEAIDMQHDMMHQEEQDLINMMASSRIHNFNGQVQVPLNLASTHLPVPISPSALAPMGYDAQRNLAGMVPSTNIHLIEPPWGSNMQFMQGLVSPPMPHSFTAGLASNPEEMTTQGNDNLGLTEVNEDATVFWHEQETGPSKGFDPDNGSFQLLESDDGQPSTSGGFSFVPSLVNSSGSFVRHRHNFVKENRDSREDYNDVQYQNDTANGFHSSNRNINSESQVSSLRSKPISESNWQGSSMKASKSTRDKRGRKAGPSAAPSTAYRKAKSSGWQHESASSEDFTSQVDESNKEYIPLSIMSGTEVAEKGMGSICLSSLDDRSCQLPSYELVQLTGSDSVVPITPKHVSSSSQQRAMDNNGVLPFTFYPTGPPIPFLTMVPVYNFPTETGNSDGLARQIDKDNEVDRNRINQPDQNNMVESLDQSEMFMSSTTVGSATMETTERKPDILNSDFLSHLQNLQYGRLCQNSRYHGPWIYPSPVIMPPMYLQGHFPWDGPGRPLASNANFFSHVMNYGTPRLVPVTPLQPGANWPPGTFQRYGDEVPRHRGGTGTYLPNPNDSFRDCQSSSTKNHRMNYNYDRNDHGDRERNWNFSSKSGAAGRNHGRSQADKASSRLDRLGVGDSRADRPWDSRRHEVLGPYEAKNGPFSSANSMHNSTSVYRGPSMNSSGVTNGPAVPSVVMLYSYDHNSSCGSQAEQLEFQSLGPVHFSGINQASQLDEGGPMRTVYEQRHNTYQGSSGLSSPDQPSSPQLRR